MSRVEESRTGAARLVGRFIQWPRIDDNLEFVHGCGVAGVCVYENYGGIVRIWWGTANDGESRMISRFWGCGKLIDGGIIFSTEEIPKRGIQIQFTPHSFFFSVLMNTLWLLAFIKHLACILLFLVASGFITQVMGIISVPSSYLRISEWMHALSQAQNKYSINVIIKTNAHKLNPN